jgi:tetratricopeptide (TPR) repeat protein
MGIYNAELFNNLGLCCFYAQQYDMTVTCFEQALNLATDEAVADVWYNIANVAIVSQVTELICFLLIQRFMTAQSLNHSAVIFVECVCPQNMFGV